MTAPLRESPVTGLVLGRPITLEQTVYAPGNERNGVWASPLLESVIGSDPKVFQDASPADRGRLNLRGDMDLMDFTLCEVRRSYAELPARLLCDLVESSHLIDQAASGGIRLLPDHMPPRARLRRARNGSAEPYPSG